MDWEKYNLIPEEYATAREIGLAAATLGAYARRGFVEVLDTSPKKYRKSNNPAIKIYQLYEQNKSNFDTYFTLWKKDEKIGMLCSISNNIIVDCWGNSYNLNNIEKVQFGKEYFII